MGGIRRGKGRLPSPQAPAEADTACHHRHGARGPPQARRPAVAAREKRPRTRSLRPWCGGVFDVPLPLGGLGGTAQTYVAKMCKSKAPRETDTCPSHAALLTCTFSPHMFVQFLPIPPTAGEHQRRPRTMVAMTGCGGVFRGQPRQAGEPEAVRVPHGGGGRRCRPPPAPEATGVALSLA